MGQKRRQRKAHPGNTPNTLLRVTVDAIEETGAIEGRVEICLAFSEAGRQRGEAMGYVTYVLFPEDTKHNQDEWDDAGQPLVRGHYFLTMKPATKIKSSKGIIGTIVDRHGGNGWVTIRWPSGLQGDYYGPEHYHGMTYLEED